MSEPLVSVIIPVYNVCAYLDDCMDSILAQKYENIEVLLIDDGSTDGSRELCDLYALQDERVHVYYGKHGGPSVARNVGLQQMKGEYVTFLDADDYVRSDYVEALVSAAQLENADLVIGSYEKVAENAEWSVVIKAHKRQAVDRILLTGKRLQREVLSGNLSMYVHGKLYRRELFDAIRFPEGKIYEDVPVIWQICQKATKICYINSILYFYRQRSDSIVNCAFSTSRMDQLRVAEEIYETVKEDEKLGVIAGSRCFFCAADNYAMVTSKYPEEKQKLAKALITYRAAVLQDEYASISLKGLAAASYVHLYLVRVLGRIYKKHNRKRFGMRG